jgi:hypothetical protein
MTTFAYCTGVHRIANTRAALIGAVLLVLSACGGGGSGAPTSADPPTNPPTNPPADPPTDPTDPTDPPVTPPSTPPTSSNWDSLVWDSDNWA